jgi:hypothetical protein
LVDLQINLQLRDAGATEQRARLAERVKELEAWAGHVKEVGPAICQEKLGGWGWGESTV